MRRFTQIIVMAGLTTAALTGNAAAQDLRSPDARDSARAISSHNRPALAGREGL